MSDKNEFNQTVGTYLPNWHAAKKPERKILQGEYCSIVPMDIKKHSKPLFENISLNNQGESWTYLPYGPFVNHEDFCVWLKTTQAESDTELYAIVNTNGQPIGVAGYLRINPEHGVIEIGHLHFSTLLQKTPAATEAMYLMMRYAFDDLGYRRYEWKCNTLNKPSEQAALRLGFTFEGIFRQSNVFKNRNRDTAWFSIIDSEWPDVKRKLITWLDKSNFDEQGNQKTRLSN